MAIDFTIHAEGMRWNIPPVSLVTEINTRRMMSKPRNVTNFHTDELELHIKAIEECGYPGVYIEMDAYTRDGHKSPDYYALMVLGHYDMAKFWHVLDEMRVKYPVRPKITIQEAMLGPSAESLQRVGEMKAAAEVFAESLQRVDEMNVIAAVLAKPLLRVDEMKAVAAFAAAYLKE